MYVSKFKIGDSVSVLDDIIKGTIIAIHNKRITIIDDNEFRYSYNEKELVFQKKFDFKIDKISLKKEKKSTEIYKSKSKKTAILEVDLHIYQITEINTKNWSNFEILSYQLNHAKHKLEYAIKNKISKVIFIHGKGKGVLRTELQILLAKYPVDFMDASYIKHGFGATEVRVKSFKI